MGTVVNSTLGRSRWAAIGAAVAVALGSGGLIQIARATSSSGERSVFVAITPCRLFDTRPGDDNVGTRNTPLVGGTQVTFAVRGSNGRCTIPADAVAVLMNVTSVGPTADAFLTLWPADQARPQASSLNWVAGQAPTPNSVTVRLSVDGQINAFTNGGTVDLIADIGGYFVDHNHDDRYYQQAKGLILVSADGTPVQNGDKLRALIASIVDASAANPYTLWLGPGVYDVGATPLVTKAFVDVAGSGSGRTIITAPGSNLSVFDANPSTVVTNGDMELRDLTIRSTGGAENAIAVMVESGDGRLRDVRIEASGGTFDTIGITSTNISNAGLVAVDTEIIVTGGSGIGSAVGGQNWDRAVRLEGGSISITNGVAISGSGAFSGDALTVLGTRISVTGGGGGISWTSTNSDFPDRYVGIDMSVDGTFGITGAGSGTRPFVEGSVIRVFGSATVNTGIGSNNGFLQVRNSSVEVSGGAGSTALRTGSTSFAGSVRVDNSTIVGSPNALIIIDETLGSLTQVDIGASRLNGTVTATGNRHCIASYTLTGSDYVALDVDCINP